MRRDQSQTRLLPAALASGRDLGVASERVNPTLEAAPLADCQRRSKIDPVAPATQGQYSGGGDTDHQFGITLTKRVREERDPLV